MLSYFELQQRGVDVQKILNSVGLGNLDTEGARNVIEAINLLFSDHDVFNRIRYYSVPDIEITDESNFTFDPDTNALTGLSPLGASLTTFVIPYKNTNGLITEILPNTFVELPNLTDVTIPSSITTIGEGTFEGCTNLIIWCCQHSAAEQYAEDHDIEYRFITQSDSVQDVKVNNQSVVDDNGIARVDLTGKLDVTLGYESELDDYPRGDRGASVLYKIVGRVPGEITIPEYTSYYVLATNPPGYGGAKRQLRITSSGVATRYSIPHSAEATWTEWNPLISLDDIVNSLSRDDEDKALSAKMGKKLQDEKYSKPDGGIPKTDLANSVQESLQLADESKDRILKLQYYEDADVEITDISYFTLNVDGDKITGLTTAGKELTSIVVPYESSNGVLITSIGNSAFYNCTNLVDVKIPNSVVSMGTSAFERCANLAVIRLSPSLVSIETDTFSNCSKLSSIVIPDSVTSIGDSAFWDCKSLTSINIPPRVAQIYDYAFDGSYHISEIILAEGLESIGQQSFAHMQDLISVTVPNSVTSIGTFAFTGASDSFKIRCYANSYAEQYAKENSISYELIGLDLPVKDVKVDGTSVLSAGVANIDLSGKLDYIEGYEASINTYKTIYNNQIYQIVDADIPYYLICSHGNENGITYDYQTKILPNGIYSRKKTYYGETWSNWVVVESKVNDVQVNGASVVGSGGVAEIDFYNYLSPEMHRVTFRGKNLGTSVTAAQKAAIRDGSFNDLFLGDYWEINGVNWRIVDMDYWYNTGSTALTTHHLVIMPDTSLYNYVMNADFTTMGGYVGSKMYTTGLTQAKTTITAAFPNLVLTHKEYLSNAVTDGVVTGIASKDSTVELPSEIMMYGTNIFSPINDGTCTFRGYTFCKTQLALFDVAPRFIANRESYWLRDVVSSDGFAGVNGHGGADWTYATFVDGVRPYFCIG